jgi:RecA-family ATPase
MAISSTGWLSVIAPSGRHNEMQSNISQFPRRKRQPFEAFCPASWHGVEPEPVKWLVQGCIPRGAVCLFSGDSGLGKSLLMQQLQTSAALGLPWLGRDVEQVRSYGFYCEDPKNILHWRQRDICKNLGVSEDELEPMALSFRVGLDNVLMDFNRRTDEGQETELYSQIREYIRDFGAELTIIDTAAHTFNGNENVRAHVTAFIAILQQIANDTGGAVVLCAHPSVSSMQSGTGYSGSTAWRASVRAHMYLKRPKGYDDESDDGDPDERVLKTMKANWGAGSGVMRIHWQDGVFVPMPPERQPIQGFVGRMDLDAKVLAAMNYVIENGDRIFAGRQSNKNVVRVIGNLPSCKNFDALDIFGAVDRLIEDRKVFRVTGGRPGKHVVLLRTREAGYADEIGEAEEPTE